MLFRHCSPDFFYFLVPCYAFATLCLLKCHQNQPQKEEPAVQVICVEDSLLTLCALQQTTQQIVPDACVFACLTVAEALETARENGCDVLLTEIDVGKNKIGGIELARRIQELNPRVNVIFITVYPEREYAKDVLRLRASGYVRKPFAAAELKKEFENLRYSAGSFPQSGRGSIADSI